MKTKDIPFIEFTFRCRLQMIHIISKLQSLLEGDKHYGEKSIIGLGVLEGLLSRDREEFNSIENLVE